MSLIIIIVVVTRVGLPDSFSQNKSDFSKNVLNGAKVVFLLLLVLHFFASQNDGDIFLFDDLSDFSNLAL